MYGDGKSRFLISSEKIHLSRLSERKSGKISRWLFIAKPASFSDHQITPKFFKAAINYLLFFKTFSLFFFSFQPRFPLFLFRPYPRKNLEKRLEMKADFAVLTAAKKIAHLKRGVIQPLPNSNDFMLQKLIQQCVHSRD